MNCWNLLEISPTKDIDKIQKAYKKALKHHNSNKNSYDYEKLSKAYNKAIVLVNTSIHDICSNFNAISYKNIQDYCTDTLDENEIISHFNEQITNIYNFIVLRVNKNLWINLLNNPMYVDINIEKQIINFISNHKFLPHYIYSLMDDYFKWTVNKDRLYKEYDNTVIDLILNEINNPTTLTYDYLLDFQNDNIDEYLKLREKCFLKLQKMDTKDVEIYLKEAYSMYSKDLDLIRLLAYYYISKEDNISSLRYLREALELNKNDMYCLSQIGHLLICSKQYEKAVNYLEKYTFNLKTSLDVNAITDLAYGYYYSYEFSKAKEAFQFLLKLQPTNENIKKHLKNINDKIPKNYTDKCHKAARYKKYVDLQITNFTKDLRKLYDDISLRTDIKAWQNLLQQPATLNNDLFYYVEKKLLNFLKDHKYIPNDALNLLSNHFQWVSRKDEILSLYNDLNVTYIFYRLSETLPLSYSSLKNIDVNISEHYLALRENIALLISESSTKCIDYLNEALNLYSEDDELYRLYGDYYLLLGNVDEADNNYKKATSINANNCYCIYQQGIILADKKNYKLALDYLEKVPSLPFGQYLINTEAYLTHIALCYYYTHDLLKAKFYFEKLATVNPFLSFIDVYLKNINYRIKNDEN